MPNVGGKKFPYTDEGKAAAKEEAAKSGKKMTMGYQEGGEVKKKKKNKKAPVSRVPGKTKTARGKSLEELGMTPSGSSKNPAKAPMPTAKNNTMPPVPKPQAPAMGAGMPPPPPGPKPPMGAPAPGGMGKPPMPGMKKGGKVKKAKSKSYGHGGKVRGAGIAKKGVKKCKMR